MPKIIENLREQLLAEAKAQIAGRGYKNTTIRSVAGSCGVAVGTVYNYFKSKDVLIASLVLKDWIECARAISSHPKENKRKYLEFIHDSLVCFAEKHNSLFADREAKAVFQAAFSQRHKQLRAQLAELIMPICPDGDAFLAEYVAESLLTWTMAGKNFNDIYELLPVQIK